MPLGQVDDNHVAPAYTVPVRVLAAEMPRICDSLIINLVDHLAGQGFATAASAAESFIFDQRSRFSV